METLNKDWTGNQNSIFKTLGASNHTEKEREERDYYATEPRATYLLLAKEKFDYNVWECACGGGHMSEVLNNFLYKVRSTDIVNRGYAKQTENIDFLNCTDPFDGDIITNPPYKYAIDFVYKGLELTKNKLALFLKVQFLEGKERRKLFDKFPPKVVYVSSSRLLCAPNGDFESTTSSAVAYAWFVWEKGFKGDTVIKWI